MNKPERRLHLFSWSLLTATLCLIFVGGLVTSTQSGLSVPDWPLSYGKLMPPMVGGIFYEHGHRMVATAVGMLTVILAFCFFKWETRPWTKKIALGAVGLVILQGVLGGLTVLLRLPPIISIFHACTAQTFFSLVVSLVVWTSSFWRSSPPLRTEPKHSFSIHHLTLVLFIVSFIQLILGAIIRHLGWGVQFHVAGASTILILSVWNFIRQRANNSLPLLKNLSNIHLAAVITQIVVGLTSYFLILHHFSVIPIPMWATLIITSHVMVGAFVLGVGVAQALVAYKTKPENPSPSGSSHQKMADYYELTKPGISFTAAITALAGFILGSRGHINFIQLIHTAGGTLLVAGAAGTMNMFIEKEIDAQMKRTQKRPLPSGRLNPGEALFLGVLLGASGLVYLTWAVNGLTALVAGITLAVYLYVYTPLKKISSLCTAFGAVAGALPPVMGWTAATNSLGLGGWVLFAIIFFWQFPHFFALAWLYKDDYSSAGLHMLPELGHQGHTTAGSILLNSVLMLSISLVPTFLNMAGLVYLSVAVILGLWMVWASILFVQDQSRLTAKKVFIASIIYVPVLMIALVLG